MKDLFQKVYYLYLILVILDQSCILGEDYNWQKVEFTDERKEGVNFIRWVGSGFLKDSRTSSLSIDGKTWYPTSASGDTSGGAIGIINDIIFAGGQVVAVGYEIFGHYDSIYAEARIGVSPSADPFTWSTVTFSIREELNSIAWDGSNYYTVGYNGTIIKSSDAIAWSILSTGITENLEKVSCGNGTCIIIGHTGESAIDNPVPVAYFSTDGSNWQKAQFLDNITTNNQFMDLTWGKSGFVITGYPASYYSADGANWVRTGLIERMDTITWCDSALQYVGVKGGGGWFDAPRIFTSVDGQNWTEHVVRNLGGNLNSYYAFSSIACHGEKYVAGGLVQLTFGDDYPFVIYSP